MIVYSLFHWKLRYKIGKNFSDTLVPVWIKSVRAPQCTLAIRCSYEIATCHLRWHSTTILLFPWSRIAINMFNVFFISHKTINVIRCRFYNHERSCDNFINYNLFALRKSKYQMYGIIWHILTSLISIQILIKNSLLVY